MIDLTAPIVPGKSAGSISVGASIDDVLAQATETFEITTVPYSPTLTLYSSANIVFYVIDGKIMGIMVRAAYQGKVHEKIGIGSTLKDVERELGRVLEEDDSIVAEGVLGISFEIRNGFIAFDLPIEEIRVYEDEGLYRWAAIPVEPHIDGN